MLTDHHLMIILFRPAALWRAHYFSLCLFVLSHTRNATVSFITYEWETIEIISFTQPGRQAEKWVNGCAADYKVRKQIFSEQTITAGMERSSQKATYTLPIFNAGVYKYEKQIQQRLQQQHNYSQDLNLFNTIWCFKAANISVSQSVYHL